MRIRAAVRYVRTVMAEINDNRQYFPGLLAALDAVLVTALTYGLIQTATAAINFAGDRWRVGTYDLLGLNYMNFGDTTDYVVTLTAIAFVTYAVSYLANIVVQDGAWPVLCRSWIKTVLSVTVAVAWLPGIIALAAAIIGNTPVEIGDLVVLACLLGPICVPGALTLNRPTPAPAFTWQDSTVVIPSI